ncbi:hypothetical protein [Microbacterium sp. LWH10-1.2]|uniref:hypothetical protein n=1 Tax=Microbacterium sp. LWH10-1.2 TaxID=3135255 RepID=UPI003138D54E
MRDPYLVEFQLVSNSRADIPSAAFDAGRSLTIRVEPGSAVVVGDVADKGIMTTGGVTATGVNGRNSISARS